MISKRYAFFAFCFLLINTALAQRQNVYYVKNSGKYVDVRDSADFIRIVSEPDSGTTLYNLKEYYVNGTPKRIGKTSKIEPIALEGQCLTYYPSGKKRELANYKNNEQRGNVFNYYPNGILYNVQQYSENPKTHTPAIIIQTVNDSTGKALVTDGNGYYIGYDEHFKYITEEGNVKAGVKDGDWKGQEIYKENKTTFTEKYEEGKFIGGQSTKNSDVVKYTKREVQPEFRGGETAFARFLMDNIHYPNYDKEHNITGRVMIKFVVEKDGSLTEMEIYKSASIGLNAEAMRVLKQSPKWIPGYYFGRPVRVQYTVPINFSLAE